MAHQLSVAIIVSRGVTLTNTVNSIGSAIHPHFSSPNRRYYPHRCRPP